MAKEPLAPNTVSKEPLNTTRKPGAQFGTAIFGTSTFGQPSSGGYTKEALPADSLSKEALPVNSISKEDRPANTFTSEALSNQIS